MVLLLYFFEMKKLRHRSVNLLRVINAEAKQRSEICVDTKAPVLNYQLQLFRAPSATQCRVALGSSLLSFSITK